MSITNQLQKIASFDVDAQNCFTPVCPDELPVVNGEKIVPELNQQALYADFRLGSKDAHSPNAIWVATKANPQLSQLIGKNVDVHWVPHAVPGTVGFELIAGLPHPNDYDFFVWKGVELDMHPYGACYHDLAEKQSTGAIEFLKINHVGSVIVGGLATDYCVKVTVLQLLRAGFRVIVNQSACRGINLETTTTAIQTMLQKGAIMIDSSTQLADVL